MRCRRGRAPSGLKRRRQNDSKSSWSRSSPSNGLVSCSRSRRRHPRHHQVTRVGSGSIPPPERARNAGTRFSGWSQKACARVAARPASPTTGPRRLSHPRVGVPSASAVPCSPDSGAAEADGSPVSRLGSRPSRIFRRHGRNRAPASCSAVCSRSVITANSSGPEMSGGASCTTGRTRSSVRAMRPSS